MNTVQLDFLYHPKTNEPQITGTFYEAELYDREREATKNARHIREATDRKDDKFTDTYATIIAYTVDLTFHFSENTPPALQALETWWGMVKESKPMAECYLYMIHTVHSEIIRALRDAVIQAIELWPQMQLSSEQA